MKTILLGKYITRLANLNDQLCFFQFNRNELNKKLSELDSKAGKLYTTDVFPNNSMASRIHVKIEDLPIFQDQNQTFSFGSYISTSYEIFSYYLKDSLELLSKINSSTYILTSSNQIEEKYFLTLNSSLVSSVPREIIDTIKYLRLRRNHFVHLSEAIDTQLNELITINGLRLNSYWSTILTELDFSSMDILKFDEKETIDILKLFRIILEELDANIAASLSHEGIAEFLTIREYSAKFQWKNTDLISQRVKKIRDFCVSDFSINISESIIQSKVEIVGWK